MKKTTNRTLTVIMGLVLVLALAWMIFLAVTNSPLRMTVIPAAMVCGVAAIALAKLDQMRTEGTLSQGTSHDGNVRSKAA